MNQRSWRCCGGCGELLADGESHADGCPKQRALEVERVERMADAVIEELRRLGMVLSSSTPVARTQPGT